MNALKSPSTALFLFVTAVTSVHADAEREPERPTVTGIGGSAGYGEDSARQAKKYAKRDARRKCRTETVTRISEWSVGVGTGRTSMTYASARFVCGGQE